MKLTQILGSGRIAVGQIATSKNRTLEEIARLLALGAPSSSQQEILNALSTRERLGSTGLGHGVAMPHGRLTGIDVCVAAFLRLKHPVDYEAHDGRAIDLVFGLLVPQHATGDHLKHLAAIAEKFSEDDFCAKVRAAADADAVHALLLE